MSVRRGPLSGLRVLELAGIGPVPFACMLLADAGADVVRIDRPSAVGELGNILDRGRRSIALDLKDSVDRETAFLLASQAEILVEGLRPGVIERLGFGPAQLHQRNPRLVIGRMTGWGQTGPLANSAGHDINYIAISGALSSIGPPFGPPTPPLNLIGDFGGGAMMLLFGVLSALFEARTSGHGQVIDAAMSDGSIALMGIFPWMRSQGRWSAPRGGNWMDGGSHYYNSYCCADGKYVAVGAVEPQFYAVLCDTLGLLDDPLFETQNDPARWPEQKRRMAEIFLTRTRLQWCIVFEGRDACFSPVLDLDEVATHPHNSARGAIVRAFGLEQPAPVPRFSRTPGEIAGPPATVGSDRDEVLSDWLHKTAHETPKYATTPSI